MVSNPHKYGDAELYAIADRYACPNYHGNPAADLLTHTHQLVYFDSHYYAYAFTHQDADSFCHEISNIDRNRHAQQNGNADPELLAYRIGDQDAQLHGHCEPNVLSDVVVYGEPNPNGFADGDEHQDAHPYSDPDPDPYVHGDTDPDQDADYDADADGDVHTHCYSHHHADADANTAPETADQLLWHSFGRRHGGWSGRLR